MDDRGCGFFLGTSDSCSCVHDMMSQHPILQPEVDHHAKPFKRLKSNLQPEPGHRAKRIKRQSSLERKWEIANTELHLVAQSLKDIGMRGDVLQARILPLIFSWCPPGAYTGPIPNGSEECKKLIRDNPDLVQALERAINSGNYQEILSLPAPVSEDCDTDSEDQSVGYKLMSTGSAATVAWTAEYQGNYHEVMLKNINSMDRGRVHASSATIIQSSGTGKSRMAHELATLVFTIPFNLRNPEERNGSAYPPEDTMVWKYLCDVSNVESARHGEAGVALFFARVFSQVAKEIPKVFKVSHTESKLSPADFARRWREHLSQETRSLLYEKIVKTCEDDKAPLKANFDVLFRELENRLHQLLKALVIVCAFPNSSDIRVLLYFDEAHELDRVIPNDERKKKLYDVQSMNMLLATFTEMPFDCHPSFPLRPGAFHLEQLGDLTFLARFGRPLFWTLIEASKGTDKSALIQGTVELARMKLISSNDIYGNEFSFLAMLATLDVLITIDYEPRWTLTSDYEMDMVASHMRVAFSIPWHRFYMHSGYPSEPFLAEAASRQMYHYLQFPGHTMANLLQQNLDSGLINLNQKGEVVMRLLLRMAYMNAIIAEQADKKHLARELNFSKGCSVVRFLKALFGDQFHDTILKSKPDDGVTSTYTLQDAFKHAVVRFTHFVKAVDESVVSTKSMVSAFLRGVAFICHNRQKAVDIIIPILLDRRSVLQESSMSALFIQVKRRRQSGSSTEYIIDEEVHGFFPNKVSMGERRATRPYVTLVAELGVDKPPKKTSFVVTGNDNERSSNEHPRYGIRAYTCTDRTWKVVRAAERDMYKRVLSTDDFLADHPRQDEASLAFVHQMLPFWHDKAMWYKHKKRVRFHDRG
ncbi:hypothetical protein EDC04DRAFT_3145769 [Pisolithus marmoratus]|nr:hypothetical protein EDC04DRAFT_3145769 [Pisolithus marmoratus]